MGYSSVLRPGLFDGQVIVVTGGGSGIGRCMAHELSSLGALVVIMGRTQEKLEKVTAEIQEEGGRCDWRTCDIREEETVTAAIASVVDGHGPIHGLVNNAGGQYPSLVEGMKTKGWESVIRNNLTGTFIVMREVFNQSMKEHGGSIVNITADHHGGFPGMSHTGAARAGVANLTMTAAVEWSPHGVRVNEVAPGTIASSGMDTYDEFTQAFIRTVPDHVPLGRLGNEAEVSGAVCFLLSPAASYITGAQLRIDGGAPLGHREMPLAGRHDNAPAFDGYHLAQPPEMLR